MSNSLLMVEQWSKGLAELVAATGTEGFAAVLLAAVRRLVDFDFVMAFAYRETETPLALGDSLDPARRRIIATDYAAGPFLLDPFFGLVRDGKRSGCHRLHAVAPDLFRRSEYFRAHYGRTGIGDEIGFIFTMAEGLTGVTSFARWAQSPRVGSAEMATLQAIEPAIGALCARHWSTRHGSRHDPQQTLESTNQFKLRGLSVREREIVTMILQGHSTESIALQLDISPGTVKIHRKNIYRKLEVATQAALFAAFFGLTNASPRPTGYSRGDIDGRPENLHLFLKYN